MLYSSLSAFSAAGVSMQTISHNLANMNTDGYKSLRVALATGPQDHGVRVAGIFRDMSAGPMVVDNLTERDNRTALDRIGRNIQDMYGTYDKSLVLEGREAVNLDHKVAIEKSELEGVFQVKTRELSNVELGREFVNMINLEAMYSANAAAVRAQDELTGTILNLVT